MSGMASEQECLKNIKKLCFADSIILSLAVLYDYFQTKMK